MNNPKRQTDQNCTIQLSDVIVFHATSVKDLQSSHIADEVTVLKGDILARHDIQIPGSHHKILAGCSLRISYNLMHLSLLICDSMGGQLAGKDISGAQFDKILSDYLKVCNSYSECLRQGGLAQLETIDMGRRALHNEAADVLMDRFAPQIVMDHETARRLFALLAAIHRSH